MSAEHPIVEAQRLALTLELARHPPATLSSADAARCRRAVDDALALFGRLEARAAGATPAEGRMATEILATALAPLVEPARPRRRWALAPRRARR